MNARVRRKGVPVRAPRPRRGRADSETRERLLDAALGLFAEHGFDNVTVRDISHTARANLAAVSYHFGDKLGLYAQIVEAAIERMCALHDASMAEAASLPAEAKLRHYIQTYLPRIARPEGRDGLVRRLMRHELEQPSELAQRVVKLAIQPRLRYLSTIVAELIGCPVDDPRVQRCVMSVQAQCLFHVREGLRAMALGDWPPRSDAELASAVEHVTAFSLAGIQAAAPSGARRKPR